MSDPVEVGLGECDVPISIQNVKVTPIPGKYPFRVLTFINNTVTSGPSFTAIPAEQDIYWMDIAVHEFSSVEVWATSREEEDTDNWVRAKFRTTLQIPWEGVINLNFSTMDIPYENNAAWPPDLGFATVVYPNYIKIPCRVAIANEEVGVDTEIYSATWNLRNPNVRCYLFAGVANDPNKDALIQVRGF